MQLTKLITIFALTTEYQNRLSRLGIDFSKPITFIFEDLLNLTEFLYAESEKDELDRFRKELNRLKNPTN